MSEFLTPSMHDDEREQSEPTPSDPAEPQTPPPAVPPWQPAPVPAQAAIEPRPMGEPVQPSTPVMAVSAPKADRRGPGALGRLISLIITVGLAWALTVAITAWLLGLFLSRG